MDPDGVVREQLLFLLRGGNAHISFDKSVAEFPLEHINSRPPNVPYSPWHLLEHLRIAQWDILEYIRNPEHVSPSWPERYWPPPEEQANEVKWHKTMDDFRADLQALQELVGDTGTDLYAPVPHARGYTIFRGILTLTDHNAYHIGEFAILWQVMGTWAV